MFKNSQLWDTVSLNASLVGGESSEDCFGIPKKVPERSVRGPELLQEVGPQRAGRSDLHQS